MRKIESLVGRQYGRWTVLEFDEERYKKNKLKHYWICKCSCGTIKSVLSHNLKGGQSKSCGCYSKESQHRVKHNLCRTRFYHTWQHMKERCLNENHVAYIRYKNIGISDEWLNFNNFVNDMYQSYLKHCEEFGEKETTLNRINNKGTYCKSNCRWATHKEQSNNMSTNLTNKLLTVFGEETNMKEFSDRCGIASYRLSELLKKYTPEQIVNEEYKFSKLRAYKEILDDKKDMLQYLTPRQQKILEYRYGLKNGKFRTLEECGQEFGLTRERVRQIESKVFTNLLNLT